MLEEMHATITIQVCGWSSLATEFPCNHEDSIQPENPKAASALVFESGQAHLGECSSLALGCPGFIHLQMHVHQHGSQLSGSQPAPGNLARTCLGVPLLCPTACPSSAFFFLPHQSFLFSDHHISRFSPSYQKSASHFPFFVFLRTQENTFALFLHRERQHRTKGPRSCGNCCRSCCSGCELTRFQKIMKHFKYDA